MCNTLLAVSNLGTNLSKLKVSERGSNELTHPVLMPGTELYRALNWPRPTFQCSLLSWWTSAASSFPRKATLRGLFNIIINKFKRNSCFWVHKIQQKIKVKNKLKNMSEKNSTTIEISEMILIQKWMSVKTS